jgi:hypothetical protein
MEATTEIQKSLAEGIKRDDWGTGPWDTEPFDRAEWRDEKTGLPCLAHRNRSGAWCGYVAVPPGHPAHGKEYGDVDASAHGGLTYADKCSGAICHVAKPGEPDDVWWLGFDCAHLGDMSPGMAALTRKHNLPRMADNETYKTFEYVKSECARLAEQLAAMKVDG